MNKKSLTKDNLKSALRALRIQTLQPSKTGLVQFCKDYQVSQYLPQVLQEMKILDKVGHASHTEWQWNIRSSWDGEHSFNAFAAQVQRYIAEKVIKNNEDYLKRKSDKEQQKSLAKKQPVIKSTMVSLGTRKIPDDDTFLKQPLIQYPEKKFEDNIKANQPINPKPIDGFTFNQLKAMHTLLIGNEEIIHYNGMEFKDATLIKFIVGDDETITTIIYFDCGNTSHRMDTLKLQHRVAIIDRTENKFTLSYK